MNKDKNLREEQQDNIRIILKNLIYLSSTKVAILALISIMAFITSSDCLKILTLYTEKPATVANAYSQGSDFDYETSEPFKAEIKMCIENLLLYSLKYNDIENYKFSDSIQIHIDDEMKRAEEQIEIQKYLAQIQIEKNDFDEEYIKKGFIKFKNQNNGEKVAFIDDSAIIRYNNKLRDNLIEGYKKSSDSDYRAVSDYIDSLDGVNYAIIDNTNKKIFTNLDSTEKKDLKKIFSKKENSLLVFNSKNPYYAATSLKNFSTVVESLATEFDQNFDFYISFDNGLYFNERCAEFETECIKMYKTIFDLSFRAASWCLATFLLSAFMVIISGRREYKGAIKYGVTDHLPNDIHLCFHIIIAISMIMVIDNSVWVIKNPSYISSWFSSSPGYYIFRAQICAVILHLVLLAATCCFKRHFVNKSVISNTAAYKILRIFRKHPTATEDENDL